MAEQERSKENRPKAPRRLVLLRGDEKSEIERVLAELPGTTGGTKLHAEVRRLAREHPGRLVAAEWEGDLGWIRFMWCGG
jgi:hypothetical protein